MEVESQFDNIINGLRLSILILTILLVAVVVLITPSSAQIFTYGSNYNYSQVVLPNNSYVHQGENISQGRCYDLSGVYGFSGVIAHWKYEDDVGYTYPDTTIDIMSKRGDICITEDKFPVGNYYQWDGNYCKEDDWCSSGFGHGNTYVFHVVAPLAQTSTVETVYSNITVESGGQKIEIPVTYTVVSTPVPSNTPDIAATNITTIELPTTEPTPPPQYTIDPKNTPIPVTPKASLPVFVVIAAIFGGILCHRK